MFMLWKDIPLICTEMSRFGGFCYFSLHYEEFHIFNCYLLFFHLQNKQLILYVHLWQ
jgi:hypothetical protein